MVHRFPALFAMTLSLLVLAEGHRVSHRGRYYNTHRFVRPAGRGRIGDGIIPVHRGNSVTPPQFAKKHFQEGTAGGRVLKKPPAQSPGGDAVPEGGGAAPDAAVDVASNLNGQGICPPVRLSCTVYRTRRTQKPPVEECLSDADCGTQRKCCFDSCVQKDVCKSVVPDTLLQQQQKTT
ncbi:uncharacterized protein [Panulirus ornatus]|uniref:uncharacterized protein isoform X2 n=1 Tax=Panulirus ornatus TaxID=150431 RepID=UPI003A8BF0B3